jgi:hypothetical protein
MVVDGEQFFLGSAELWVPASDGSIFAAPNMIVHYVEMHGYLPPPAFVLAVERCPREWDPEPIFEEMTLSVFK